MTEDKNKKNSKKKINQDDQKKMLDYFTKTKKTRMGSGVDQWSKVKRSESF